jgi:hypothetical protein
MKTHLAANSRELTRINANVKSKKTHPPETYHRDTTPLSKPKSRGRKGKDQNQKKLEFTRIQTRRSKGNLREKKKNFRISNTEKNESCELKRIFASGQNVATTLNHRSKI